MYPRKIKLSDTCKMSHVKNTLRFLGFYNFLLNVIATIRELNMVSVMRVPI
jgi:hypothetical protein